MVREHAVSSQTPVQPWKCKLMVERFASNTSSLFSVVSGILYALSGILFIRFQANRFDWNSIRSIKQYLAATPHAIAIWTLINWGAALASLLAIANVQALVKRFDGTGEALAHWSSILAMLGYGIIAVTNIADLHQVRQLGYNRSSTNDSHPLGSQGIGSLDPDLNLRFITLGPWFLTIGFLALPGHLLPKPLAYLGVFLGSAALVLVIANILKQTWLLPFAAAIAVVLHPVWLIWTGIYLTR